MLKSLIYKNHLISMGQSFVNYLFLEVIFNNNILENNMLFTSDLIIDKYKGIVDNVNNEYLLDSINIIFLICKNLKNKDLKLLRRAVHVNNKIENLCIGDEMPITYREINKINLDLSHEIQKLSGRLYKYVIDLQPFYSIYGRKSDFYKNIIGEETVCNCCGVGTMLNIHQEPVGALDHYFPINHYPFSSINFKNLVPICDICNSKYKTQKDTLFKIKAKKKNGRKIYNVKKYKAFYPYSDRNELIDVSVNIISNDLTNLKKEDIVINYSLVNGDEEIENWERLFKVSEIHKANLLSNESRNYINQQFDIVRNLGMTIEEYHSLINSNPFYDKNFIRVPYLKEFNRIINS